MAPLLPASFARPDRRALSLTALPKGTGELEVQTLDALYVPLQVASVGVTGITSKHSPVPSADSIVPSSASGTPSVPESKNANQQYRPVLVSVTELELYVPLAVTGFPAKPALTPDVLQDWDSQSGRRGRTRAFP